MTKRLDHTTRYRHDAQSDTTRYRYLQPMSTAFQTAVRTNVQRENRYEAIDRLVENDERTNLSIIVQMGGLDGEFRRRALEGLSSCRGTEELEELAADTAISPSLRRRADELA